MNDVEEPRLSSRDREVLTLLTWGYTNQMIADELFVSISTVKSYIAFAYRKIGVTRRTQAILWGVRHGLSTSFVPVAATAGSPETARS
jgi:DNA-binding NarL/FixJ family response regulator